MASDPLGWWTRDRRVSAWVFMGCTLLNVPLLCLGGVMSSRTGPAPPGQVGIVEVWFALFAFPVWVTMQLKDVAPDWAPFAMAALNPWVYGLLGWCVWRMWKLMRAKRAEEDDEE
jgi:hypothetical protein